jgi:hypothetical protein
MTAQGTQDDATHRAQDHAAYRTTQVTGHRSKQDDAGQ